MIVNQAITYSGVRNPVWGNASGTIINCEVNWDHVGEETWSPCSVVASGDFAYIHEIYNKIVNGDYGSIGAYVRPADIPATHTGGIEPAKNYFIREARDEKLAECDHMMLADNWNAMTSAKQAEWTAYRQALRDLPSRSELDSLVGVFNDTTERTTERFEPSVTIPWPTKPS